MYAGKIRIRACGLLKMNNKLLLIRLTSPVTNQDIWTAPGGGVEVGESILHALQREFKEETGIDIIAGDLVYINEFIEKEFHAFEFFFQVEHLSGELQLGYDPEYEQGSQLIKEVRFYTKKEIQELSVTPDFIKDQYWDKKTDKNVVMNFFK